MVDFNLDDPLGDLLSDGSNDSFFGTTSTKKKSQPIVASISKSTAKMEDLFGIKDDTKPAAKAAEILPSKKTEPMKTSVTVSQTEPKRTVITPKKSSQKEINFDDGDDDPLFDLGFDPKNPKSSSKKSSILDDLLGVSTKPKTPVTRPQTSASRQSTVEQPEITEGPQSGNYISSLNRQRPSSTKRGSSSGTTGTAIPNDPLGFFAPKEPERETKRDSKPIKNLNTDWLGINTSAVNPIESQHTEPKKPQEPAVVQAPPVLPPTPVTNLQNIFRPDIQQTSQLMTTVNVDQENALQNLRHQEAQLMIATQMKNQEVILMEMQRRQQNLLAQQEQNFNDLLQKQLQRQGILEESIKRQQEKINSHIQILMVQPDITPAVLEKDGKEIRKSDEDGHVGNVIIELEADVKRLELEKLRLEDLLHNVKTNHEHELELLEQSHKKQLSLLEENLQKLENRLRSENANLEDFYEKKILTLNAEKENSLKSCQDKFNELAMSSDKILAKVRSDYEDELATIKNNHKVSIETIRQSKLLEFSVVQENSSYLEILKSASTYLENAGGNIESIQNNLQEKIERAQNERERRLAAEEKKIEEQKKYFEKLKESNEIERTQLLELVKTLETKLNSITQTSAEEQWSLRQQKVTLEVERTSFERERNFAREQIARDEKRLEDLKMFETLDIQRRMKQLEEDRQEILAEKVKFETMARLNRPIDTGISRTEVETAIKIAQDAARQSDVERERFMYMQRQFEVKKRELVDLESNIRSKESELDRSTDLAISREKSAETATKSTDMLQQKLRSKLETLQQHFRDLMNREQTVSAQKLELSKERLELQTIRKRLYQSRCSLCKIGDKSKEISDILTKTDQSSFQVPNTINEIAEEPFKELSNFDHLIDADLAHSLENMNDLRTFEIDLNDVPNLTNTSDHLLDTDLLMLKFDALQSNYL